MYTACARWAFHFSTNRLNSSCNQTHVRYGSQKVLVFETRYRATVFLRSVFISVPFYNFPCFYCCVSILKVRRKERLKNSKKNGMKNGVKTVQKTDRKIITIRIYKEHFKKQYNNVFTSVPIGQMVFNDYTKRRILLLRECGKRYERNFGTAAEKRYSSESSRDFKVFNEVQAEVQHNS